MILCFSGEREAEGKQDKMDGKEDTEVLLEGGAESEQLMFIDGSNYNIFRKRDHDKGLWGVLPYGSVCVGGGAISVGRIEGRRLFIEVF